MTRSDKRRVICASFIAASMLAGCTQVEQQDTQQDPLSRTGMALTTDILSDTDVAGIAYTITGVDCITGEPLDPALVINEVKDLEDLVLPGGNQDLNDRPFDADSQHLFADAFFLLPEGCYDVFTQPIQEGGAPSEDCAAASQSAVPVFDGQTTEILLINQCENDGVGGLDVISALNHEPQLLDVRYEPSKFTCEGETRICAVAQDDDNDPLLFTWSSQDEGVTIGEVIETALEEGGVESCAQIILANPGDYTITLVVQDLANNGEGEVVTIESLLAEQGNPLESRDEIDLLVHAMSEEACVGQCECPDGFTLNITGEACERIEEVPATFNGELLQVCRGSINGNYGALGVRFPGGTIATDLDFFGTATLSTNNGSRLNTQGIWACDENGEPPGNQVANPIGEWIGFSRCLDIEEAGAYVVGIGADDYIRVRVNGTLVFNLEPGEPLLTDRAPFAYWWMIPAELAAGINIIEVEAMNATGPASFASEIYGPFATGSTSTDASLAGLDYENNIVFTTGDQIGNDFNTGTNSGFSCEDGFALNLCGGEAICSSIERTACQ